MAISIQKEADPEFAFIFHNGTSVQTISELLSVLKQTDDSVFYAHVRQDANDFANWIQYVFKQKALASQLLKTKDKQQTITLLENAIKPVQKKIVQKKVVTKKSTPAKKTKSPKKKTVRTKTASKRAVATKKSSVQTKQEASQKKTLAKKQTSLHTQIAHLHNQTKHLTKNHSERKNTKPLLEKDVGLKDHLIDFALGFTIGLILGFIIARGLGL